MHAKVRVTLQSIGGSITGSSIVATKTIVAGDGLQRSWLKLLTMEKQVEKDNEMTSVELFDYALTIRHHINDYIRLGDYHWRVFSYMHEFLGTLKLDACTRVSASVLLINTVASSHCIMPCIHLVANYLHYVILSLPPCRQLQISVISRIICSELTIQFHHNGPKQNKQQEQN